MFTGGPMQIESDMHIKTRIPIIIINGKGGSGKDYLIENLPTQYYPINLSTIDFIKYLAKQFGWRPEDKDDAGRKMLYDLKMVVQEYNNFINLNLAHQVGIIVQDLNAKALQNVVWLPEDSDSFKWFNLKPANNLWETREYKYQPVIFVHCREPESIMDLLFQINSHPSVQTYCPRARTCLVQSSETDKKVYGNRADDEVNQYHYDWVIYNDHQSNSGVLQLIDMINKMLTTADNAPLKPKDK